MNHSTSAAVLISRDSRCIMHVWMPENSGDRYVPTTRFRFFRCPMMVFSCMEIMQSLQLNLVATWLAAQYRLARRWHRLMKNRPFTVTGHFPSPQQTNNCNYINNNKSKKIKLPQSSYETTRGQQREHQEERHHHHHHHDYNNDDEKEEEEEEEEEEKVSASFCGLSTWQTTARENRPRKAKSVLLLRMQSISKCRRGEDVDAPAAWWRRSVNSNALPFPFSLSLSLSLSLSFYYYYSPTLSYLTIYWRGGETGKGGIKRGGGISIDLLCSRVVLLLIFAHFFFSSSSFFLPSSVSISPSFSYILYFFFWFSPSWFN